MEKIRKKYSFSADFFHFFEMSRIQKKEFLLVLSSKKRCSK